MTIKKIYRICLKTNIFLLFFLTSQFTFSQNLNLDRFWEDIGPKDMPLNDNRPSAGIGPIEFIKISKKQPNFMLAGSLYGGLFCSEDSGENWINAGSDNWNYSNCGWACFHPLNENMWFATSMEQANKAKPGKMGKLGGVFRTKNKGTTWETIADYSDFSKSDYVKIFGIRFHPNQPNRLYALTSEGVYFSEDCTANNVTWSKVNGVEGKIYDLEIENNILCVAQEFKKKWHILYSDGQNILPLPQMENESRKILHVTIEPKAGLFYILVDYERAQDEVWRFNPSKKSVEVICDQARVLFGSGYAFALNPFDDNEIMMGNGLRVRKWLIDEKKFLKLNSDYHVDIEHVAYHPTIKDKVYIATHGGVFVTYDNGLSWEFSSVGLSNAEVLGLAVSETDPNQVVVGLNHDGSIVRADWQKNGTYEWQNVNGGDALLALVNPNSPNIVYTSNQYSGGGLYISHDTAKTVMNLHSKFGLKTSGWAMACVLHPTIDSMLFFNYTHPKGVKNESIDVARMTGYGASKKLQIISDFGTSHGLKKYQVFSLFNSSFHPNILLAYVLDFVKDENDKSKTLHKLFYINNVTDTLDNIITRWRELELPRNGWVGDIVMDKKKWFKMYVSYVIGSPVKVSAPDEKGMIFYAKYKKTTLAQTRNWDISSNIPSGHGGKNNLVYTQSGKIVFIATQSGVYMGTKSTLKGGRVWKKVGYGLPHCKSYGLHYHEGQQLLTVGLKGRGVWRLDLSKN